MFIPYKSDEILKKKNQSHDIKHGSPAPAYIYYVTEANIDINLSRGEKSVYQL